MELVGHAVEVLESSSFGADDPVLEAGLFAIYSRPYMPDRKRRVLGDEWLPADPAQRKLHDRMLELRSTIYAHTDPDSPRGVEDVDAMLGLGEHGYAESRPLLNPEVFPRLAALAQAQRGRFREARELREQELRDDPPSSSIAPLLEKRSSTKASRPSADDVRPPLTTQTSGSPPPPPAWIIREPSPDHWVDEERLLQVAESRRSLADSFAWTVPGLAVAA
jgi:hypothetical protein